MKVSGWQNVRDLILDGWQLGSSHGGAADGGYWLQKGGLGRGGESKQIHSATAWKMIKENIIKPANSKNTPWYRTDYVLTEPTK